MGFEILEYAATLVFTHYIGSFIQAILHRIVGHRGFAGT